MNKKTKFIMRAVIALVMLSFWISMGPLNGALAAVIGLLIVFPISSFFSMRGMDPNKIYIKKWNRILNLINILIIVLAIALFMIVLFAVSYDRGNFIGL